jgi:hypothetical protein
MAKREVRTDLPVVVDALGNIQLLSWKRLHQVLGKGERSIAEKEVGSNRLRAGKNSRGRKLQSTSGERVVEV